MTDGELTALSALLNAEVAMIGAENQYRLQNCEGVGIMTNIAQLDVYRALDAEVRKRGLLTSPVKVSDENGSG